jgi:hypothetical protein
MARKRSTYTMPFEVERGNATVEYEVEYEVSPGEPERGPTYDCGGTPASPPEVESRTVYFVYRDRKTGKTVREERPELEDLVDDEELLEHAGDAADYDGPDTTAEARGER